MRNRRESFALKELPASAFLGALLQRPPAPRRGLSRSTVKPLPQGPSVVQQLLSKDQHVLALARLKIPPLSQTQKYWHFLESGFGS